MGTPWMDFRSSVYGLGISMSGIIENTSGIGEGSMGSKSWDKGHGKIPRAWFNDNDFITSLTPGEKWVLTCLTTYVWRVPKARSKSPIENTLCFLYDKKHLLVAHMSERTIADKCGLNRSTVCSSIDKFDDVGAAVKVPGKRGRKYSNLYILGFELRDKSGNSDRLFSNSPVLSTGGKMPEDIMDFIRLNYDSQNNKLYFHVLPGYEEYIGTLLFSERSPLIQKEESVIIRLDRMRRQISG
jgi:hypothetical protein